MRMPPFCTHWPESIDEACDLARGFVESGTPFDWVAGGTDLLANYKWHLEVKPHVISLARIPGLDLIDSHEIGAMARLEDLVHDDRVHPLIAQAAGTIASSLIRRNATLGGNLCLDTRCFWYNQSEEWRMSIDYCHKADCGTGADCRVIPNQNTLCVATYQGDLAPNLMVLEAEVHLIGPNGPRSMPLSEFYALDGITRNVLAEGEFLLRVTLPERAAHRVGAYRKLRMRESWDFPEAGIAASWVPGDDASLRVASTALESIPRDHAEQVAAHHATWRAAPLALGLAVQKAVKPVNNTAMPPRYRRSMVSVLTRRALTDLEGGV